MEKTIEHLDCRLVTEGNKMRKICEEMGLLVSIKEL